MRGWWVLSVGLLLLAGGAEAVNLEKLVMPGKLIEGHAKYEEDCDKCHESFSKKSQRRLCLDCHKEVAVDIEKSTGFHGRDSGIRQSECKTCHSDHLGRDADIVQFNRSLFDHKQSDFALKGRHEKLICSACHKSGEPYRKAPGDCYSCHKSSDVHQGKFERDCGRCHTEDGWRKTRFDHDKTRYKLTGKHREVSCELCHPNQRYKDLPRQCNDCHRLNDIHRGAYGQGCQDCHSTQGWRSYLYDHDQKTKFPLRGKHKDTRCDNCHQQDYQKKLPTDCYSCHREQDAHQGMLGKECQACHGEAVWREHAFKHESFKNTSCNDCHRHDDVHQDRYGNKCGDCHQVQAWKEDKFNHDTIIKFPLRDSHAKVACLRCHQGEAANERGKTACHQCHALDDVHHGKEGKECQLCHSEVRWRETINFNHQVTRFPLIGLHATTPCEECHVGAGYKDTKRACHDCHEKDDSHKGRLGANCAFCHNPNSWKFWQFDHDKQSDYKLEGAHREIACEACHKTVVKQRIELSHDCNGCHRSDDVHGGDFGRQCERCHNSRDFREITL